MEVLVGGLDVLQEDMIKGKTGGTNILCSGGPGLGKTLLAQVMSETLSKVLYSIHCGHLGTDPKSVKNNLEAALERGHKWGAVVLLDEADVYIRRRGDDVTHNAIVASFLQSLEYFDGLLFMTTNRENDVDDAIESRCIAHIKFKKPEGEHAARLWKILTKQYEVDQTDKQITELMKIFPPTAGRDIKELSKLVARYCMARSEEPTPDVFRKLAQFKGLV